MTAQGWEIRYRERMAFLKARDLMPTIEHLTAKNCGKAGLLWRKVFGLAYAQSQYMIPPFFFLLAFQIRPELFVCLAFQCCPR